MGERIFACRDDAAALARARAWWGDEVTSIYDGCSTSALLTGMMWLAAYEECPQAEYTGIALEYGTLPMLDVMNALRADQWLENHPEPTPPTRRAIKQQMRDAFYTDTDEWMGADRSHRGSMRAYGAVRGLAVAAWSSTRNAGTGVKAFQRELARPARREPSLSARTRAAKRGSRRRLRLAAEARGEVGHRCRSRRSRAGPRSRSRRCVA